MHNEIPDQPEKKPVLLFGIFADAQYADLDEANNRFYRSSEKKLREAYETFRKDSVDFVLNLGDLIDRDYKSFLTVIDIINSSGIKTYHLSGNHDYLVENRLKKKLPVLSENQKGYYSFTYDKFRFILLNGNEISTYAPTNKSDVKKAQNLLKQMSSSGEINALDWNGGMSGKQIDWLKKQLDESVLSNERVFIVCHFPAYPVNKHNFFNYKEVLSIIGNYKNIIAWLNGHNHEGNYGNFNMIHFYTFRGMVESSSLNSFAIVEVYNNRIWIKGFGREKNMILAY